MKSTSSKPKEVSFAVPPEYSGKRLDVFLVGQIPHVSRTHIHDWVKNGNVISSTRLKGLKPSLVIKEGETFTVHIPPVVKSHMEAQPLPLDVVFEDQQVLVVNKPAGLVVHPGAGNPDKTLMNALVAHCPEIEGVGGVLRPGMVHRLDKDTSGLLAVAKTDVAFRALVKQLKSRKMGREYLAIVKGLLDENGKIDAPVGRHIMARKKMAVQAESGRHAITHFRPLVSGEKASLLHLKLETGRTHQIRVHMSFIKHSVLGDPIYGGETQGINRQMLHAFRLSFTHPKTGIKKSFMAPPPSDFQDCLDSINVQAPDWKEIAWDE